MPRLASGIGNTAEVTSNSPGDMTANIKPRLHYTGSASSALDWYCVNLSNSIIVSLCSISIICGKGR